MNLDETARIGRKGCVDWLRKLVVSIDPPQDPPPYVGPPHDMGWLSQIVEDVIGPAEIRGRRMRNTVTVSIEWDADVIDHQTVAAEIFDKLSRGSVDEDNEGPFRRWGIIRTHPWKTTVSWVPKPKEISEEKSA